MVDQAGLEELVRQGSAIYERLRPQLESDFSNQFVAIHADSGDHAIGGSAGQASRGLREKHPPDGRLFVRKIWDEPEYELAARLLAGEQAAGARKRSSTTPRPW